MADQGRRLYWEQILQAAAGGTGNGTPLRVDGMESALLQVSGTFTATVTFEATLDESNWVAVEATKLNDGTAATTATAAGLFRLSCAGLAMVRARVSAYTSGNVTVQGRTQA